MKLLFDLHTHTMMSGHAYSTLQENIAEAKKKGLLAYGFSDHAPALPGTITEIYFTNFKVVPKVVEDMQIFCGVEANIIDYDGNIDCTDLICKKVQYIIASLHTYCIEPGSKEENTRAMLGAIRNPYVKILGHPDDSRFPIDFDVVAKAAKENGTIIELNNSSMNPLSSRHDGLYNGMERLIAACMKYGTKMIVGSDAHISYDVGKFDEVLALLEEMQVPEKWIINTDLSGLDEIFLKK